MNAAEFLRKDEWTMGNGQCPDCCGLAPGKWFSELRPHPCCPTPGHEGHDKDCQRAAALVDLGEKVTYRTEEFL